MAARGQGLARAARTARRAWPYVIMAWERWQALPPDQRERYLRRARYYAERGHRTLRQRGTGSRRRGPWRSS